jgi:ATP/maltotriose-dependent transcriptional regulator MalT
VAEDEQLVWQLAQSHAYLGILLAYTGNWDDAEHQVARSFECAAAHDNLEGAANARVAASALARARNDSGGVIEHLGPMAGTSPVYVSMQSWPSLVDAHIDIGDLHEARAVLKRMEDAASRRHLHLGGQVLPLRARLAAAEGDGEAAASLFAQALAEAEPEDPYLDRTLVHQHYGQLLFRLGRRREGAEQLHSARDLLAAVGAAPFVERVDRDLVESGASSSAGVQRGARGLTEREEDVATLVAQGLSNPEVAAQLYVSRKAVEYHLRNIFDKLGISSRRELQRDRQPA